jgi:hypothetical protein
VAGDPERDIGAIASRGRPCDRDTIKTRVIGSQIAFTSAKTATTVKMLDQACKTYKLDFGEYPPDTKKSSASLHHHLGIQRKGWDDPEAFAILVMNDILGGGGFTSRLMDNIRTKAGLAYSVGSFFAAGKSPGPFEIVMQTKNASVSDAITRARQQVEQLRTEAVTDDELEEARRYLTGSYPLRGNHWSVEGDSNPSTEKLIGHLRGPNHGHQIAANYAIESWSYEELRSLHDDLHEREIANGTAPAAAAYYSGSQSTGSGVNYSNAGHKMLGR